MRQADLETLTLVSASRLIQARKISPVELTEAVLDRIEALNPDMGVFITVTGDRALKEAGMAEKAMGRGEVRGRLHGIPVSLKDVFHTRGIATTAGSLVFADRMPAVDATVVRNLGHAGTVMVGKTNMHEFAYGVTSVNPHYGPVRNPWKPDCMAGGSSGGSAVSVSLAMAFGSVGSDTGGSIRIPAALCGVVGLKPTYGRVSAAGVVPLSWSLDHVGLIARTVEDVAHMLNVLAGLDPRDSRTLPVIVSDYALELDAGVRGLRFGLPRNAFERLAPEVDRATQRALRKLERLGGELQEVELPATDRLEFVFRNVVYPEAFTYHERYIQRSPELYGEDTRRRIEMGRALRATEYVKAQRERGVLQREFAELFDQVDVLVSPTTAVAAPSLNDTEVQVDGTLEAVTEVLTRNTRLFNVTGLPAISVPCGFTVDGLPVGLQMAGRAFDEGTVLRAAFAYEQDEVWFQRRPLR